MTAEVPAAQVYTILQSGQDLRAGEIARLLGGTAEGVERCLRLLIDMGLLRYSKEGGFTVVCPETGMSILLSRAQAQLARSLAATMSGATAPAEPRAGGSHPDTAISAREWEVLQLLAQGCTDEVVARNLDVSLRTVRRVTADLMARLGARSRFQAGLKASRLLAERTASRPAYLRPVHARSHRLPEAQRRRPAIAAAG